LTRAGAGTEATRRPLTYAMCGVGGALLALDCVDAAVIACAERNGGRVMSFDRRDFGVVAAEATTTLVPSVAG